ncbi:MAG: DUF4956 domain-containing protein [Lachnospiraceae bacterium]|nr:DUF4956 domain-containing protein [Lachnospiraceae bacterium]
MLSSLLHAGTFDLRSVLLSLGTAILLGLVIALIYKQICLQSGTFALILAVLPLLVASVILIVNGNLGTSVAVLGAFGLIRFRSAPGTAKEIMFIFFTMAVGLACGMGFLSLALIITILVGLSVIVMEKTGFSQTIAKEKELRITIPEDLSYNGIFDDLFLEYTKVAELSHVKTTNMGTMYELCYHIIMRDPKKEKELIDAIRCRNGNLTVLLGLVQRERNEL